MRISNQDEKENQKRKGNVNPVDHKVRKKGKKRKKERHASW